MLRGRAKRLICDDNTFHIERHALTEDILQFSK